MLKYLNKGGVIMEFIFYLIKLAARAILTVIFYIPDIIYLALKRFMRKTKFNKS